MIVPTVVRKGFEEVAYFHIDEETGHGFLIDPGAEAERLIATVRENRWTIERILLTHGHYDHIAAARELRSKLGAPICATEGSDVYLLDAAMNLSEAFGDPLVIDGVETFPDGTDITLRANTAFGVKALHTPGHTKDSTVYYDATSRAAFVGDTLFRGRLGTWHYPGGDRQALLSSTRKILSLPDDVMLYPGHSAPVTVAEERQLLSRHR